MHLARISIYPVKSLRGVARDSVAVEPWGPVGDRRYLVVDLQGRFLTQRECPGLAKIDAELEAGALHLGHAAREPIRVPTPIDSAERTDVMVWRDTVTALRAGEPADRWLSDVLGRPCRLVYMADPARDRAVDPAFGQPTDHVSFADGYPLLATTSASLDDLNAHLATPVGMDRFRPNLVIADAAAWAEDEWRRIQVGDVLFDVVKPCARCIVTTTDQMTGVRDPEVEPIRTLQRFRRNASGQVIFGQNLVPRSTGTVSLGDPVTVIAD